MSHLVNLERLDFTERDIKTIIGYLAIDKEMNKNLIQKTLKFGAYVKKYANGDEKK